MVVVASSPLARRYRDGASGNSPASDPVHSANTGASAGWAGAASSRRHRHVLRLYRIRRGLDRPPRKPAIRRRTCRSASSSRWLICTIQYHRRFPRPARHRPVRRAQGRRSAHRRPPRHGLTWLVAACIKSRRLVGLPQSIMWCMLGQTRIFFRMATTACCRRLRTGASPLPHALHHHHPHRRPGRHIGAGVLPLSTERQLRCIGTLLAFVLVCVGVLALRITQPDFDAPVQDAGRVYRRAARRGLGVLPDVRAADRHLAAAWRMVRHRGRRLFLLRHPAQPGATNRDELKVRGAIGRG